MNQPKKGVRHVAYRCKGVFDDKGFPSVAMEITVKTKFSCFISMSQTDPRGLPPSNPLSKRASILFDLCAKDPDSALHERLKASSDEVEFATKSGQYNYKRDIGMMHDFEPSTTPYYVVPRIHSSTEVKSRPYVLTLICEIPYGTDVVDISMKTPSNKAGIFENYTKYDFRGDFMKSVSVDYQVENLDNGDLFESNGALFKVKMNVFFL